MNWLRIASALVVFGGMYLVMTNRESNLAICFAVGLSNLVGYVEGLWRNR